MLLLNIITLTLAIAMQKGSMEALSKVPIFNYLNEEVKEEVKKNFNDFDYVLLGKERYAYPINYTKVGHLYYNLKVRSDDTWIVTFPRSGTTWAQELVWLINNDMNFSTALSVPLRERFPFLEISLLHTRAQGNECDSNSQSSYESVEKMASPRFVKTHFSLSLVPEILSSNCKIIYVARNPKDLAVSYFNFLLKLNNYKGTFEKFWEYFEKDLVTYAPYWKHLKEAWAQRNNENLLFIFYEEMISEPVTIYKKVAEFFGKSFNEDQYKELVNHLMFSNFQNNTMVNGVEYFNPIDFVRKGKIESWHSMFTPELKAQANRWIEENLRDTDLKFPYVDIYS